LLQNSRLLRRGKEKGAKASGLIGRYSSSLELAEIQLTQQIPAPAAPGWVHHTGTHGNLREIHERNTHITKEESRLTPERLRDCTSRHSNTNPLRAS